MLTEAIKLTLFPAMMAFAASSDLLTMTIANRVSLILIGGFGLLAIMTGMSATDALLHVGAGASVLVAAFALFSFGWIGGGDVKLLTACALLVPPTSVPELILTTAIAGAVLALLYLASEVILARLSPAGGAARPTGLFGRVWRAERRRIRRRLSLPYACAICAGVLLTLNISVPLG